MDKVIEKRYRVAARLAILPDETQGQIYLEKDMLLPQGTPQPVIEHLLESGVIKLDA